jgi:hypothetical protein
LTPKHGEVIRDLSHLSGLYGPDDQHDKVNVLEYLEDLLDRVALNYTRGLRGYFFGLPLFFWLLSAHLMIVTVVIILCLLLLRDHAHHRLPLYERKGNGLERRQES